MSHDAPLPERRHDYRALGERMAAVETEMHGLGSEVRSIRGRLHTLESHTTALLLKTEENARAHQRGAAAHDQIERKIDELRREAEERAERVMGAFEQHDRRDDQRFDADGSRLSTLERQAGIYDARAADAERELARRYSRRTAFLVAAIGTATALLGVVLGWWLSQ